VIYYLAKKACSVYDSAVIRGAKYSTMLLMGLLSANLLVSLFYPGSKDEPNCPGIWSRNLIIVKIASTIIMLVCMFIGIFIYKRVTKYKDKEVINERSIVRANYFLKKLKMMMLVFLISALTDLIMNTYHLVLQAQQGPQASCDFTEFSSDFLNTLIYEIDRLTTFFIPIASITQFFWISRVEASKKLGSNLLDSPELTSTPSANFFSSLYFNSRTAVSMDNGRRDSDESEDGGSQVLASSARGL